MRGTLGIGSGLFAVPGFGCRGAMLAILLTAGALIGLVAMALPQYPPAQIGIWVKPFFRLRCRNQSFHVPGWQRSGFWSKDGEVWVVFGTS